MEALPTTPSWVPLDVLARVSLALLIGLLVGLEREWRGKEAGLRTFGLVSLLGGLGGLLGESHAVAGSGLVALLVVFLNLQAMRAEQSTELTTSAALCVIFALLYLPLSRRKYVLPDPAMRTGELAKLRERHDDPEMR